MVLIASAICKGYAGDLMHKDPSTLVERRQVT